MLQYISLIHFLLLKSNHLSDFPGGSDGKASVYNAGDPGSIPGREDPLEKEMAIHSSTTAWKIPWTEEPGRLQSMGSQRVRHDCVTNHITYRYTLIYSSVDGYLDCFHFGIY